MEAEIGHAACALWRYLDRHGEASLTQLRRRTKLSDPLVFTGPTREGNVTPRRYCCAGFCGPPARAATEYMSACRGGRTWCCSSAVVNSCGNPGHPGYYTGRSRQEGSWRSAPDNAVLNGRAGTAMAPFKEIVSPEVARKIREYVRDLARLN